MWSCGRMASQYPRRRTLAVFATDGWFRMNWRSCGLPVGSSAIRSACQSRPRWCSYRSSHWLPACSTCRCPSLPHRRQRRCAVDPETWFALSQHCWTHCPAAPRHRPQGMPIGQPPLVSSVRSGSSLHPFERIVAAHRSRRSRLNGAGSIAHCSITQTQPWPRAGGMIMFNSKRWRTRSHHGAPEAPAWRRSAPFRLLPPSTVSRQQRGSLGHHQQPHTRQRIGSLPLPTLPPPAPAGRAAPRRGLTGRGSCPPGGRWRSCGCASARATTRQQRRPTQSPETHHGPDDPRRPARLRA
jgi:hypothetical protein